jgi:carboxyl-terminal processing protease
MSRTIRTLALIGVWCAPVTTIAAQTTGRAAEVIEQYITALGGREALARSSTVEFVRERSQFGTVAKVYRIEDVPTKRYYQRVDAPDGVQEQGYDGRRVWQKRAAFHGYLSDDDPVARQAKNPEPDIRDYRETGRTYTALPNETVNGVEYVVLQGIQPQPIGGDIAVKFYFDPATHLLRRRSFGNVVQVVQTLSDYRKVGDISVPFELTTQTPQGNVIVKTITHRFGVPIADSLFQYRENGKPVDPPTAEQRMTPSPTTARELSAEIRRATFNFVWEKTRDTYWDSTFGGVDWNAVRDRYWPMADATTDSRAFHAVLSRMVGELHVSHFHVRPPEAIITGLTTAADLASRPNATPGISVAYLDNKLVVSEVDSGSTAADAGIRPGFVIDSIDKLSIDSIVKVWRGLNPDFELKRLTQVSAAQDALRGVASRPVVVGFIDDKGRHVTKSLERRSRPLGLASQFKFESRRLPSDIGYIRWTIFYNDAVEQFIASLDSLRTAPGLIIDLRGNPGGVGVMSRTIASQLMRDSGSLGTAKFRHETQRFTFPGLGAKAYTGKVVVLVDEHSGSTSEVFAAGLQDLKRVTVIGDTTAGAVLPSNADQLPSGGNFQHPISNYTSIGGSALEGRGVIPDIVVRPTRESLLAGKDAVLERAIRYMRDGR